MGFDRLRVQVSRRFRQLREVWKVEGPQGITTRIRRETAERLAPKTPLMLVDRADVLAADLSKPFRANIPEVVPGQALTINWVTIPAAPRSGGHSTMYRIIRYLEAHGHRNRLYFYNVYRGDYRYYESIAREHYGFHGIVGSVDRGMEDAHAVVATSWPTAYPVFNSRCAGKRYYFVQDFEPYFYPVGAVSLLAENTYRMGFHAITAGRWLAQKLGQEFAMSANSFDFGSDSSKYHRISGTKRSGVVFYARPEAARRGFELGLMALEILASRRADLELHLYGEKMGKLPFRFVDHGRISAEQLNEIYNRCYAGLSLSLTNVSLVPHEMLACGCIPVVNDAAHNRIVLDNSHVRYVPPEPNALAAELELVASASNFDVISQAAAASVHSVTWNDAGASVEAIFHRTLTNQQPENAIIRSRCV